jgi:hypothetical protein
LVTSESAEIYQLYCEQHKKSLKRTIKMKEVRKAIFWAIITEKSHSRKEECIKCSQINLEQGLGFHFSVNCSESLEEETEYKHKN